MSTKRSVFSTMLVATLAVACGASNAVRPADPSANQALGENGGECRTVDGKPGEPLIVDWKPEQRGDLEVAMKQGVAVVSYSCKGIKVLPDCRLAGDYAFMGITKAEEVVQLQNGDEVRANLPMSGAQLGASLDRGSTIEIAMVMVGKKRTTLDAASAGDLKGSCDGATHFVRGATVGAFVMDTGTSAKARTSAEILGAGASAGSSSSKQVHNKEGDSSSCSSASPDADRAPAQCGAPIRIVLSPIAASAASARPASSPFKANEQADACPNGMVVAEGKCTTPNASPTHLCRSTDADDCKAQCDKGHAGSCGELGRILAEQSTALTNAARRDTPESKDLGMKAVELMKKGCDGGSVQSCVYYGIAMSEGFYIPEDDRGAIAIFERGCAGGSEQGCFFLADEYLFGKNVPVDEARAALLDRKACAGGYAGACAVAGFLADANGGSDAAQLYQRGCDGGNGYGCAKLGERYEIGRGVPKDVERARALYTRGCELGHKYACFDSGRLAYASSPDTAKAVFGKGCHSDTSSADALACTVMELAYDQRVLEDQVAYSYTRPQAVERLCERGDALGCGHLGLYAWSGADYTRQKGIDGSAQLKKACGMGDKFACAMVGPSAKPSRVMAAAAPKTDGAAKGAPPVKSSPKPAKTPKRPKKGKR